MTRVAVVDQDVLRSRQCLFGKVTELNCELPGIHMSYAGSFERGEDQRIWTVFLPHKGRNPNACLDAVYLGFTHQLPDALGCWEQTVDIIRARYRRDAVRREELSRMVPTLHMMRFVASGLADRGYKAVCLEGGLQAVSIDGGAGITWDFGTNAAGCWAAEGIDVEGDVVVNSLVETDVSVGSTDVDAIVDAIDHAMRKDLKGGTA